MSTLSAEKKIIIYHNICKLARVHNGACISESYHANRKKLAFICKNNHIFYSTSICILGGAWCTECSGLVKLTIEKINSKFEDKKIKCLTEFYVGNKQKLNWQCLSCNFTWKRSKNLMDKDFKRCQNCFKISQLEKAKTYASSRGGVCISKTYEHSQSKIKFKCKNNHEFETIYANAVNSGNWCQQCSNNIFIAENICREYFQAMFGCKFEKIKADWLLKDNGYKLELDGYSPKFNLAFEHNGYFHFKNSKSDYQKMIDNDFLKIQMCKNNKTNLIVISDLFKKTPLKNLRNIIINKCKDLNIIIPNPNAEINFSACYDNEILKCDKIAQSKGGIRISNYLGQTTEKVEWQCKENHVWKQFPYVIDKGSWCPVCNGSVNSPNIIKK